MVEGKLEGLSDKEALDDVDAEGEADALRDCVEDLVVVGDIDSPTVPLADVDANAEKVDVRVGGSAGVSEGDAVELGDLLADLDERGVVVPELVSLAVFD